MRREGSVHFRFLYYLLMLCKGTFLSSTELYFIILRTFILYSEFSAYLLANSVPVPNNKVSEEHLCFMLSKCFFFLFIIGKKNVIMPKCQALAKHLSCTKKFKLSKFFISICPPC